MPRLIDVSRTLQHALPVWPGDPPVEYSLRARRVNDTGTNVGHLSLSLHAGTHADAFFHYDNDDATIDQLDPSIFVGPCVVVDVGRGMATVTLEAVRGAIANLAMTETHLPPRVLIKTDAWVDDAIFPHDFPGLEPALADWLGSHGIVLVGVDVPSVDAMSTPGLPAHLALGRNRITILESLRLRDVEAGVYELIALPLKIAGADGSPVRAVLVESE